jgi:hypothetical protein
MSQLPGPSVNLKACSSGDCHLLPSFKNTVLFFWSVLIEAYCLLDLSIEFWHTGILEIGIKFFLGGNLGNFRSPEWTTLFVTQVTCSFPELDVGNKCNDAELNTLSWCI